MSWRERLATHIGPGLLAGITFGDWLRLLGANHFRVHPACSPKAAFITCGAITNSLTRLYEDWRYSAKIRDTAIQPPLFVLGHWRSGTTLVHDLLARDDRFAYPNLYQVSYPHTFLTTEKSGSTMMRLLGLKHRPQDNMRVDPQAAWEDEFAMCAVGFHTPYLTWAFPRRADHYDRFLTFCGSTSGEVDHWRMALRSFLRKLSFKHGKLLILKSPTHTCRIKLLLEMFPDARFVHIHRNPYAVFQSTLHTYATVLPICRLQSTGVVDWTDRVIRLYKEMYDAFFEQRGLIPAGHFHELCFEQLERDPVGQMRQVYEAIDLPDFATVEPSLRRYVESLAGYRKNAFPDLPPELRQRIGTQWRRCFAEWGYTLE